MQVELSCVGGRLAGRDDESSGLNQKQIDLEVRSASVLRLVVPLPLRLTLTPPVPTQVRPKSYGLLTAPVLFRNMNLQDSTTTLTLRLFCDPMVRPYLCPERIRRRIRRLSRY